MHYILLVHRYLAVAVGLLMTLWCLSGFVMMYQSMPELTAEQRLNGLQPLMMSDCCDLGDLAPHDSTPLAGFRIEMLLDKPVLRFSSGQNNQTIDLTRGEPVSQLSPEQIIRIAEQYGVGNDIDGSPVASGTIQMDQWTIQSARRNQPAWHIIFDDLAGTEIYVNGLSGEVFQQTNRRERVLAWFGAIPHWLYPTVLRQNAALWTDIVVWTSILGTFLAATGLYVGISRLCRQRVTHKLKSPYKGLWYWHHISGLVFGILVLTWVFSGLMTMNPWGALSGSGGVNYRPQLTGAATWSELKQVLTSISNQDFEGLESDKILQITPAVFDQHLFLMVVFKSGESVRFDRYGRPAPMQTTDIERVVAGMDAPVRSAGLMHTEDLYYYGHKRDVPLPVYRVLMDDDEQTRIYIDTQTGAVRSLGTTGRWSRWIRTGLHDLDFPGLRTRPVWDIVVILLLTGVTLVCATGTWMSFKRVRRDILSFRRRIRKKTSYKPTTPYRNTSA